MALIYFSPVIMLGFLVGFASSCSEKGNGMIVFIIYRPHAFTILSQSDFQDIPYFEWKGKNISLADLFERKNSMLPV